MTTTTTIRTGSADEVAAYLAAAPISLPGFDALSFESLSLAGCFDAAAAGERLLRFAQAFAACSFAELHRRARKDGFAGAIEAEVGAAIQLAPATAQNRLAEAAMLLERFPETLDALRAGRVAWMHAVALVQATAGLEDEAARKVQAEVLAQMPGWTLARTRRRLRAAVLRADPHGAAKRHAQEVKRRRVEVRAQDDGMATVSLYTKAQTARAVMNLLTAGCRTRAKGDSRTLDQRRADLLATLLLNPHTNHRGSRGKGSQDPDVAAMVHVIVNIETLLGISDAPGQIEGHGPISAVQARALAAGRKSVLRRMVIDPLGTPVHVDARARTLGAADRRYVTARDRECDFPHCAMPARLSDQDHKHPYAQGGPTTTTTNICPRCRRHHTLKTCGAFQTHDLNNDTSTWTSTQTGRSYPNTREPYQVINENDLINPEDE